MDARDGTLFALKISWHFFKNLAQPLTPVTQAFEVMREPLLRYIMNVLMVDATPADVLPTAQNKKLRRQRFLCSILEFYKMEKESLDRLALRCQKHSRSLSPPRHLSG